MSLPAYRPGFGARQSSSAFRSVPRAQKRQRTAAIQDASAPAVASLGFIVPFGLSWRVSVGPQETDFGLAFLSGVPNSCPLDNMSSQATESTRMIDFLAWAEVNKKKLAIGTATVAVVIAGYSIYQWRRGQAEAEASAALLKVDRAGTTAENAPEPNPQAFLQVAAAHPGTSAGGRALLFGGDAFFRENKFAEAQAQFEIFLRDFGQNPLAPTAALGVAACLDALNKTNEALKAYQDLLNRFAGSAVVAQAKLGMARLYEARNEPAQALKIYEELTRPNTQSAWNSEAVMWREQLLSRHPELAKTNAPATAFPGSNAPAQILPGATATNPLPANPASSKDGQ